MTWQRLRELQDALGDAQAVRPTQCGSEQMARDEAAGDALPLLLAVVEAAAIYRDVQREIRRDPRLIQTDLTRARDYLDESLAAVTKERVA